MAVAPAVAVKAVANGHPDDDIALIHAVVPNPRFKPGVIGQTGKRFQSLVLDPRPASASMPVAIMSCLSWWRVGPCQAAVAMSMGKARRVWLRADIRRPQCDGSHEFDGGTDGG